MNEAQQKHLELLERQVASLEQQVRMQAVLFERIATALERMSPPPAAPNYQRELREFKNFEWQSIGAKIIRYDDEGTVAIVEWQGYHFTRRNPNNKYQPAIWYSRCTGKGDNGNTYEKLITFKNLDKQEIEPIPSKIKVNF
jgi:hypothetical protein